MKRFHLMTIALVVFMAGCAATSKNVTYHLLAPTVPPAAESVAWDPSLYLVVGPVALPAYLNRSQMVERSGDNTLSLNEYHRWAEPLNEGIARAMAENLARLTGAAQVALYPVDVPEPGRAIRVFMDVVRFDTDEAGNAVLDVRWGIKYGKENSVKTGHTTLSGRVTGSGEPARTDALSQLVATFSREIAETLRQQATQ